MISRGGQCFLRLCSNVRQTTIQPWITKVIQQRSTVNTDEYSIYARLPAWSYVHVTVNHSEGEYARDADGDGVKYTSTPWKAFGVYFTPGCDHIAASHSAFYRCTSAFSRPCTTSGSAVTRFSARCSPCF